MGFNSAFRYTVNRLSFFYKVHCKSYLVNVFLHLLKRRKEFEFPTTNKANMFNEMICNVDGGNKNILFPG